MSGKYCSTSIFKLIYSKKLPFFSLKPNFNTFNTEITITPSKHSDKIKEIIFKLTAVNLKFTLSISFVNIIANIIGIIKKL